MTRLNAKSSFGLLSLTNNNNHTWINIICGVLLVILIVLLIFCLVRGKEDKFSNDNNKENIVMYTRPGCGYAKKAEDLVKKNNMKIGNKDVVFVDINHPSAKSNSINATPTFKYKDNVVPGFHADLNVLHEKLTKVSNNNKSNNHVMVGSKLCKFCKLAKNLLDKNGVKYDFIESDKPEAKELMLKHKASGVPLIITIEGETIMGFDEEKLNKLS